VSDKIRANFGGRASMMSFQMMSFGQVMSFEGPGPLVLALPTKPRILCLDSL
jgi:hypothetical protein